MNTATIRKVLPLIEHYVNQLSDPLVVESTGGKDPYRILISCILSLRTKEETTRTAAARLFAVADTPQSMVQLSDEETASLIYPVGFSKTKARQIRSLSRILIDRYKSAVPASMDELLSLPGVGRKTANLVLSAAFDIPAICVDTHVHRIMNRLGYVHTDSPEKTEMQLRDQLPAEFWKPVNRILVLYGRNLCSPISPWCSRCPVTQWCEKKGVEKSR